MNLDDLVLISDFCSSHNISETVLIEMKEYELVEVVVAQDQLYIPLAELPKTEKLLRLYADLDINMQGIEVITHLLNRVEGMQSDMMRLQNRLRLYE